MHTLVVCSVVSVHNIYNTCSWLIEEAMSESV
jgi:hypothetical protein